MGEGSTIEFHAAQMPTGQVGISLAGFDEMFFIPWGPGSTCAPVLNPPNNSAVVMSAATYSIGAEILKTDGDGNQWYYGLGMADNPITVPPNGTVDIRAGGDFLISTAPDKSSYSAGEQVILSNHFADSFSNQLNGIYVQQIPASSQEKTPVLLDKALQGISCCGSVQDQQNSFGEGNIYPSIVVTDPDGNIIVDESSWNVWGLWGDYSFNLPPSAVDGTYSVELSLDTGPHRGIVTASATFEVSGHGIRVEVLNQSREPAQYADVFAYSDTSQPPVAWYSPG